jgi:hypothetical protein
MIKGMKLLLLSTFLLLSSCSIFNAGKLSRDIENNIQKICLSGSGKGRLTVQNRTYVFGYDSLLEEDLAKWTLALDFPMRNQELFKLDWSKGNKTIFETSIEEKILKENKHVNPKHLDQYIQKLGLFLKEAIDAKAGKTKNSKFEWETAKKSIIATDDKKLFTAEFKQLTSGNYFGLMAIRYQFERNQSFKMDFVVRNCAQ